LGGEAVGAAQGGVASLPLDGVTGGGEFLPFPRHGGHSMSLFVAAH